MSHFIESLMYQASQVFLFPTLLVITVLFVYAFFLLGMFAMQWWQRRQGQGGQQQRSSKGDTDRRGHAWLPPQGV